MTRKKILVVDDSFTARRFVGQALKTSIKCDIILAEDGAEALKVMLKEEPDVIVLDMMMPFMNGIEVLRIMKKDNKLNKIPVIACTAVEDNSVVKQIIEIGVTKYIKKPINVEDLVGKINEIFD